MPLLVYSEKLKAMWFFFYVHRMKMLQVLVGKQVTKKADILFIEKMLQNNK